MTSSHCSCSDGSGSEGQSLAYPKKDLVKARVKAKRDQLCVGYSSMDGNCHEDVIRKGHTKLRSRASRTERYLKRMCNRESQKATKDHNLFNPAHAVRLRSSEISDIPIHDNLNSQHHVGLRMKPDGMMYPLIDMNTTSKKNNDTFYSKVDVINPLVQQTFKYFAEFECKMTDKSKKKRRSYSNTPSMMYRQQIYVEESLTHDLSKKAPPKPPLRDRRSYLHLINRIPPKPSQQMMIHKKKHSGFDKENGLSSSPAGRFDMRVRNVIKSIGYRPISPSSTTCKLENLVCFSRSPLQDLNNTIGIEDLRVSSPLEKVSYSNPSSTQSQQILSTKELSQLPESFGRPSAMRNLKNLEEALYELEVIYNSLQLEDEELLDRADRRTEEEFHFKGLTVCPDPYAQNPFSTKRKAWIDSAALNRSKEKTEEFHRLRDDMAYRKMHPKERPTSINGPLSMSSISYLMTSPVYAGRDHMNSKSNSHRKMPDITFDDVVFRSWKDINNVPKARIEVIGTLQIFTNIWTSVWKKVQIEQRKTMIKLRLMGLMTIEPQPPFGIPLGPITTGTDSDYLHSNPTLPGNFRSPYLVNPEPNLVTDDLAFRNLRKDTQPTLSNYQQSSSFLSGPTDRYYYPASFDQRQKRATRSVSANFYSLMSKSNPLFIEDLNVCREHSPRDDFYDQLKTRRSSNPEILNMNCQGNDNNSLVEDKYEHEKIRLSKSFFADDLIPTPTFVPTTDLPITKPFTKQETAVHKKLCQNLENLVQSTKDTHESRKLYATVVNDEEKKESMAPFNEQNIKEYIQNNHKISSEGNQHVDIFFKSNKNESSAEKPKTIEETVGQDMATTAALGIAFIKETNQAKLSSDWKESTPNSRDSIERESGGVGDGSDNRVHTLLLSPEAFRTSVKFY